MSNETAKTLFIHSPFSLEYAGLYQEMLSGILSFQHLGNRLIQLAEQAHAFRQFDKVKELGQLLSNIPIRNYQAIGYYFLGVAANSMGNGDQDKAQELFEIVVDTAPQQYKTKAILSLAALSAHKNNFDSELYYFIEGLKTSTSLATTLYAHQGIAVVKAKEGFHRSSLRDLENLYPLMQFTTPRNYFDYLNSYAVELAESGRINEARNISRLVLASPFAHAYPEWQETAQDLKPANRSFLAKGRSKYKRQNVLPMPAIEHGENEQIRYNAPAIVFNLQQWKDKMAKRKKGKKENGGDVPETLSERDMIFQIINMYTDPQTTNEQRFKIWESAKNIIATPDDPMPNDDEPDGA